MSNANICGRSIAEKRVEHCYIDSRTWQSIGWRWLFGESETKRCCSI